MSKPSQFIPLPYVEYRPKSIDYESGVSEVPAGNYDPYALFCIRTHIMSTVYQWDPKYYCQFTSYQTEGDRYYEIHMVAIVTHLNNPDTDLLKPAQLTEARLAYLVELTNKVIKNPTVILFDPLIDRGFPFLWANTMLSYLAYRVSAINVSYDPDPSNIFIEDGCIMAKYKENYIDQNALLDGMIQQLLEELYESGAAVIDPVTAEQWNYEHVFDSIYQANWKPRYIWPHKNALATVASRLPLENFELTFKYTMPLNVTNKHIISRKIDWTTVTFDEDILTVTVESFEQIKTIEDVMSDSKPKTAMIIVIAQWHTEAIVTEKVRNLESKLSKSQIEITKYKNGGTFVLSVSAVDDTIAKIVSTLIE